MASGRMEQQQMDLALQQQQQVQSFPLVNLESHQNDQLLHNQVSIPDNEQKTENLQQQTVQQSLFISHMQRHEALHLQHRQSNLQAQMNLLQQQLLFQQQQQRQQQTLPQHLQRSQLQQQKLQQHLQRQMTRPTTRLYETGVCAHRLMHYMFSQRRRPHDNTITFWRKFVAEYFAPCAKKRWCVSCYGGSGLQPTGVFHQDVWHCEICGSKPGRGFETTVEVLPRLFKIKYDSGILDELLYVDMPHEYHLPSGLMILEYGKAIQESIFEQLRVVRNGQLRIIFTPDLKILSWEFCARSHEELFPRRLLVTQVAQLASIAQKYQTTANQNKKDAAALSMQECQANCQMFVASARQLVKTLEAPTVNDLGYTKRYVRCLQISEVVNSMKDLIDFSQENGIGPMASLISFPRQSMNSVIQQNQNVQQLDQMNSKSVMSDQNVDLSSNAKQDNSLSNSSQMISSASSLPSLLQQNSLSSLHSCVQHNPSNSVVHPASLSSPLLSPSLPPQSNAIHSLQSIYPSVPSQSASLNSLAHSFQQKPLNSSVNLLQQSSGKLAHASQHGNTDTMHHLLQEMMMPYQLKGGVASFQQGLGGCNVGGNIVPSTGTGSAIGTLPNNLGRLGSPVNGAENMSGSNSFRGCSLGGGNSIESLGAISGSNAAGLKTLSGSGNDFGSVGCSIMGNCTGVTDVLTGRLNLSAADQEQNFTMQELSQGNGNTEWPWYR